MNFPDNVNWAMFHLKQDGSTGRQLRRGNHMISTGNYVILENS